MKTQLLALGLLAVLCACAKGGESNATSSSAATQTPAAVAAASAGSPAENGAQAGDGGKVYQTNCSSCHQAAGVGVPGVFPPLADNPVVTGDPKQVIHIVKYGLNGKIQVAGQTYNGMMPNWGQQISNADIAAAITYIRASWGNKASAVSVSDVAAVSK
jgi:mono/diheme cytochrome c family protein